MPAVDLLFKTTDMGQWGVGKGSPLTAAEIDQNFWDVVQGIQNLIDNPLQPLEIESIDVTGNKMTFTMSDLTTTFGPFTLPVAAFVWRDAWLPSTAYDLYDFVTAQDGLYLVLQSHTSGFTFDPDAGNMAGPYYRLIMPFPTAYDFGFFFPGSPGAGIEVDRAMFAHLPARDIVLPVDLVGSLAYLEVAPVDVLSFPIFLDDIQVGSIVFAAGENEGTFVFDEAVGLVASNLNRIKVIRPTVLDDDAKDLTITFKARLGSLSDS